MRGPCMVREGGTQVPRGRLKRQLPRAKLALGRVGTNCCAPPVHLVEARRAKRGGRAELEAGLAAFCTTRSQLQAGSPNFHLRRQQRPVDGRGASWPAATTAHRAPTPQKKPPRAQAEPKPRKRAAVRVRPFGALWGGWWLSSAECGPLATPFGSSFSLVEEVGLCTVTAQVAVLRFPLVEADA